MKIKHLFYKKKYRGDLEIKRVLCFRFYKKINQTYTPPICGADQPELLLLKPDVYDVGRCSYICSGHYIETKTTKIGAFCSIGQRVRIGHGEHPLDFVSTSPFFYLDGIGYKGKEVNAHNEYLKLAPITIGNDVWIGDDVTIRNGVTIGDGAVIGSKSLVTKDVAPYSIVSGIPAKLMRYRFPQEKIDDLLALKWWEKGDSFIKDLPYEDVDKTIEYIKSSNAKRAEGRKVNKKSNDETRRIGIYFFYDKDGIVDDYVEVFLQAMRPYFEKICVVVNGDLTQAGKELFEKNADDLLIRENVGLDVYAYKHAIEHYGFDYLASFDEMICTNFTIFGPVHNLDTMFTQMGAKDCDWWGLYRWTLYLTNCNNRESHHIPSFFVAYRKSLMLSDEFRDYWNNMPAINSYAESCMLHEQRQTPYYDKYNFKSEVFIDNKEYRDFWYNHWPLLCSDKLVKDHKFPFVKRRIFFWENGEESPFIDAARKSLKVIKEESSYDHRLIYDNIKRTQNLEGLKRSELMRNKLLAKIHPSRTARRRYRTRIEQHYKRREICRLYD